MWFQWEKLSHCHTKFSLYSFGSVEKYAVVFGERDPIRFKARRRRQVERRDVDRCCVAWLQSRLSRRGQARLGARARSLRLAWREPECFVPPSTGGEEMPWSASWIESTRRCESSPEPKSQAERRLNSTLSIPFILPLTMRGGAVGYEPHASSCNSHDKGQQFNGLSSSEETLQSYLSLS